MRCGHWPHITDEETALKRQEAARRGNTPMIPAFGREKQEGDELEAGMDYPAQTNQTKLQTSVMVPGTYAGVRAIHPA